MVVVVLVASMVLAGSVAIVKSLFPTITLSDKGANFIGNFEGLRLFPYLDGGGLPTIGYGHRIPNKQSYPNGITKQEALQFLKDDASTVIQGLAGLRLILPLQHHQDAVISLCFNIGMGAFRKSIIYSALEAKATDLYAWAAWTRDAKGVIESGLVTRREAEMRLFIWV